MRYPAYLVKLLRIKARHELGEDHKTRGTIIQELRDKIEHWEPTPEDEGLTFS